jgi:hypothetical protein
MARSSEVAPFNGKAWDRQPGETEKAYTAFMSYRDLGPERTLIDADYITRVNANKPLTHEGKSGNVGVWSSRWRWLERCRHWDNHLQAERDKAAAAEARKWERRRQENREANFAIAQKLRDRVEELLKHTTVKRRLKPQKDGDPVMIIEPAAWTQRDLAILSKAAADLAAQSMPGDVGPRPDAGIPPGLKVPDRDARYEAEDPG